MRILVPLFSLVMCAATSQAMAMSGDPVAGRAFARYKCAECHDIGDLEPPSKAKRGPSFMAISHRPKTTDDSLRTFLVLPHAGMPNFPISRQDLNDVIAFILGMRKWN